MKPVDWAILGAIALAIGLAVFILVRRKKRGSGCCGSCGACASCCDCENRSGTKEKTADKRDDL
ncbi:MAG: FeoB-associated Cys-rich membrane protein [Clostridia bacterium]|nr:FeoB-associated Cys-rich membrane protein [Clostridia bacterium]